MRKRHSGTIVFISSIQGMLAVPARSSYSGAKHALQGYCDSLRVEESLNGINIVTVSPAYVRYVLSIMLNIRTNHSLHSIRGDGSSYNQMDSTTKKGMDPRDLAVRIKKAVTRKEGNVVVAPLYMRLVVILQYVMPNVIDYVMKCKARKNMSANH